MYFPLYNHYYLLYLLFLSQHHRIDPWLIFHCIITCINNALDTSDHGRHRPTRHLTPSVKMLPAPNSPQILYSIISVIISIIIFIILLLPFTHLEFLPQLPNAFQPPFGSPIYEVLSYCYYYYSYYHITTIIIVIAFAFSVILLLLSSLVLTCVH